MFGFDEVEQLFPDDDSVVEDFFGFGFGFGGLFVFVGGV